MLVGPTSRPVLPKPPEITANLRDVLAYLKELDKALTTFQSNIVSNSVGVLGLRGLSSTGVVAQNFIQSFNISGLTTLTWTFTSFESNASYLVFAMQSKTDTTQWVSETTRNTSTVVFNFATQIASGTLMGVLLVR